jgi:hypothetical protein
VGGRCGPYAKLVSENEMTKNVDNGEGKSSCPDKYNKTRFCGIITVIHHFIKYASQGK